MERIFELKQINFLGRKVQILCQNENGPCPLLAIANALLLQNRFSIHEDRACISLSALISEVAEVIVESTAKMVTNNDMTRQQLLDSVLMTLPKLAKGLDLNVRFTGVTDYEFTQEISVFDALDIPLVHGWVLDPQDRITAGVIENQSYNHLMFKLVEYKSLVDRLAADTTTSNPTTSVPSNTSDQQKDKTEYVLISPIADSKESDSTPSSPDKQSPVKSPTTTTLLDLDFEDDSPVIVPMDVEESKDTSSGPSGADDKGPNQVTTPARREPTAEELVLLKQGPIIETFLADTAAQLTYVGLLSLYQTLRERQLAIFFRNDHFSTMFSKEGHLYLLVTDLGYQKENNVVWELLDEIDGDTEYVNDAFTKPQNLSFASPALVLVPPSAASALPTTAPSSSSPPRLAGNSSSNGSGSGSPITPATATIQDLSKNDNNWTSQPPLSQSQTTRYGNPTTSEEGRSKRAQDDQLSQDLLLALQLQDEVTTLQLDLYIDPDNTEEAQAASTVVYHPDLQTATGRVVPPPPRHQPIVSTTDNNLHDDFMSQFTPAQLDAMRAQELQYRALASGGIVSHTRPQVSSSGVPLGSGWVESREGGGGGGYGVGGVGATTTNTTTSRRG